MGHKINDSSSSKAMMGVGIKYTVTMAMEKNFPLK